MLFMTVVCVFLAVATSVYFAKEVTVESEDCSFFQRVWGCGETRHSQPNYWWVGIFGTGGALLLASVLVREHILGRRTG